jgi:hypothetical protein
LKVSCSPSSFGAFNTTTASLTVEPSSFTLLLTKKVVTGVLINNLWSFAGNEDRPNVNAMTLQPFFNYNLQEGWYPHHRGKPIATTAGRFPSAAALGASSRSVTSRSTLNLPPHNVVTPDDIGANWQLRAQWTFLFPTH